MSFLRRHSAAMVAALALVLGACSSEAPTVPNDQADGALSDNPLRFAIAPGGMVFSSLTATAPGPQTLTTTGLVAIGSAVEFGAPRYDQAGPSWLRINPTPTFQRDPLAWLHTVSIDQAAYTALPNGTYTATVPVIVRAAQNTPQMLSVVLCRGTSNCLPINGVANGSLSGSDPTWNRGGNPLATPGSYYFDDYLMTVPANTLVHVTLRGACSGYGLSDPYIYIFDLANNLITFDDDGAGCLDSYVIVNNASGSAVTYRVRATSWSTFLTGAYQVRASTAGPALRAAPSEVPAEFAEILARKAAMAGQ